MLNDIIVVLVVGLLLHICGNNIGITVLFSLRILFEEFEICTRGTVRQNMCRVNYG